MARRLKAQAVSPFMKCQGKFPRHRTVLQIAVPSRIPASVRTQSNPPISRWLKEHFSYAAIYSQKWFSNYTVPIIYLNIYKRTYVHLHSSL